MNTQFHSLETGLEQHSIPSVLVVDDDPSAIQLIYRAIQQYGDIRFATNGAEAYRLINERAPDVILLDAQMPGETGFELCRRIKSVPEFAEIAVIFVTSHSGLDFELQALEAGAADFIAKPISAPSVQLRLGLHLRLKQQLDELRVLAGTDGLTRLANRRTLDETLKRECTRSRRSGNEISLVLIDVDHFKLYNDAYGHPAGDGCLQEVARVMRGIGQRPADIAARFGGEEFALILPDTGETGALHVAHLVRQAVEGLHIPHKESPLAQVVTVSVGVSSWGPPQPPNRPMNTGADARALISTADQALYLAKARGRNRVEFLSVSENLPKLLSL